MLRTLRQLRMAVVAGSGGGQTRSQSRASKVALCQLSVGSSKQVNIQGAAAAIDEAAAAGASLVVLPEMWNCPYSNASFAEYAEDLAGDSPSTSMLSEAAARLGVTIVGGSIPERSGGSIFNTCFVYSHEGHLLGRYRKMHLFDIDIPGKITFKESDTLTAGSHLTVVDTPAGRLGIGICFDMRFPELAALYAARGVEVLVYPGAFNMTTGPLHWTLLQRARAVDNQLYVCACSPARDVTASYVAWGHSSVVDPFAEVLVEAGEGRDIVYATIDLGGIQERRQNMPLSSQRRSDVYTSVATVGIAAE